jgi:hypothetical protein
LNHEIFISIKNIEIITNLPHTIAKKNTICQ